MHIVICINAAANNDVRINHCRVHSLCPLLAQREIKRKTNDGLQLVRTYMHTFIRTCIRTYSCTNIIIYFIKVN